MSPHFLIRLHKKRDATLATLGKERNPTPKFESLFGKDHQYKRNTEKTEKRGIAPNPPYTAPDPKLLHSTLGKGRNNPSKQKLKVHLGNHPQINTPDKTRNPRKRTQPRMAPAHSKHLICLIGTPNENTKYVNDFNTKHEGTISDHHCWCENAY